MDHHYELDDVPKRTPGLVDVPVDGETVVVDDTQHRLHHLDASATAIWEHLNGRTSLRAAAESLAERFGLRLEAVAPDVGSVVDRLAAEGLLTRQAEEA